MRISEFLKYLSGKFQKKLLKKFTNKMPEEFPKELWREILKYLFGKFHDLPKKLHMKFTVNIQKELLRDFPNKLPKEFPKQVLNTVILQRGITEIIDEIVKSQKIFQINSQNNRRNS